MRAVRRIAFLAAWLMLAAAAPTWADGIEARDSVMGQPTSVEADGAVGGGR